jgi:erythromycin esterase-like protein
MSSMDVLSDRIRTLVQPLTGSGGDHDTIMEMAADARLVLIGEASHGTHEFYHERAVITRRLIEERGFDMVVVEADWPDAYRVNRFVRGMGEDESANAALSDFRRFPAWMWRNVDVLTFVDWLREYNDSLPSGSRRVGFYGMDLYSLYRSAAEVIRYLEEVDPEAAGRARRRYACFEGFGEDSRAYGYAADLGVTRSCEDAVVQQLLDLRSRAVDLASRDGRIPEDEFFFAEQNARLVRNAEEYYRTMFRRRVSSWNLRDRHMTETLEALMEHMKGRSGPPRAVVWAHNSHLGDARATEMGEAGEWNVGQLVRERWGAEALLIGFTTHSGTVTAADDWDHPARNRSVRPALAGSWEDVFHRVGVERFVLPTRPTGDRSLRIPLLERAIGVIYRPETERQSHYFHARLADQFDAVIHLDRTSALVPLEAGDLWHLGEEVPETYPSGL